MASGLLMMATLILPLGAMLAVLPLLGIVLNGTSSVLYGTVPELAPRGDAARAFAHFYTAVIFMGGFAPIAYGVLADHTSRAAGISASAFTAIFIVPLVLGLRRGTGRKGCLNCACFFPTYSSTNLIRSDRSISNGVMHFTFVPMHTLGIFTRLNPSLAISWVTTICPWALAYEMR